MPRISLIDENATPEIAALSAKIRGARGGQLHVFYRALLHTPAQWNQNAHLCHPDSGKPDRPWENQAL